METAKRGVCCAWTTLMSLLLFSLFVVIVGLSAYLADSFFDGKSITPQLFVGRPFAGALLFFSLISGAVGAATSLFGLVHAATWSEAGRLSNLGVNMITLALTGLSFGFAVKTYIKDSGSDNRYVVLLRVVAALDCAAFLLTLLYALSLTVFKHRDHVHTATAPGAATGTHAHHHHNNGMAPKRLDNNAGYPANTTGGVGQPAVRDGAQYA